jgi:hypothetical protein
MDRSLTRRRFLAAGAGAAAAAALPTKALALPKTADIYKLDETFNPPACDLCVLYDTNSLFPSEKAANGNRAHARCNCGIKKGKIDAGTFVALFGKPEHLRAYRVDMRWPWVKAILSQHPPSF